MAVSDFNGDGWADVVVPAQSRVFDLFLNRGDATFTRSQVEASLVTRAIRATELNGDGIADLVVAGSSEAVAAFLGNGDGTFREMPTASGANDTLTLVVADFDGDGRTDAAVRGGVLLGDGQGRFSNALPFLPNPTGVEVSVSMAAGDLNGDGRADLAVRDGVTTAIFLARTDGMT